MDINLIKHENTLTFDNLKIGAVFYLLDDDEEDSKNDLFMVLQPINNYDDNFDYIAKYNAVNLATGILTWFMSSTHVRLCYATINAEG